MNVWPISFYWIDQNEEIAAAMGWRWLVALAERCVEQSREATWNHHLVGDYRYVSRAGIYAAEMHWLEPYTYPNSIDAAPICRSFGEILPPVPPMTLHCSLVHARVAYDGIHDLDDWNVSLLKSGEDFCKAIYPFSDGYHWASTFGTWKYSAYRAIREWQHNQSRWLPPEAFQRKVLP